MPKSSELVSYKYLLNNCLFGRSCHLSPPAAFRSSEIHPEPATASAVYISHCRRRHLMSFRTDSPSRTRTAAPSVSWVCSEICTPPAVCTHFTHKTRAVHREYVCTCADRRVRDWLACHAQLQSLAARRGAPGLSSIRAP